MAKLPLSDKIIFGVCCLFVVLSLSACALPGQIVENTQEITATPSAVGPEVSPTPRLPEATATPMATPSPIAYRVMTDEDWVSLLSLFNTAPNCELPCWHGLTPGISTEAEVRQLLFQWNLEYSEYEIDSDENILGIENPFGDAYFILKNGILEQIGQYYRIRLVPEALEVHNLPILATPPAAIKMDTVQTLYNLVLLYAYPDSTEVAVVLSGRATSVGSGFAICKDVETPQLWVWIYPTTIEPPYLDYPNTEYLRDPKEFGILEEEVMDFLLDPHGCLPITLR